MDQTTELAKKPPLANQVAALLFTASSCSVNYQTGDHPALITALFTAGAIAVCKFCAPKVDPMRLTAFGMFAAGGVLAASSYASGTFNAETAVLVGADVIMGIGNWQGSRPNSNQLLSDTNISGLHRAVLHPATWYSIGYAAQAVLASHVLQGTSNTSSILWMCGDLTLTALSITGTLSNRFQNPAASYMAVTFGALAGTFSALSSGNFWAAGNKFCGAAGEFSLACDAQGEFERARTAGAARMTFNAVCNKLAQRTLSDRLWMITSDALTLPVRAARRIAFAIYPKLQHG